MEDKNIKFKPTITNDEKINKDIRRGTSDIKKILIGLPNTGTFPMMTVASITGLQIPKNYMISFKYISNCLIYDARESLVKDAIEGEYDYLFMVDSDMVFPSDTIVKLLRDLENGYDLASGMCFKRSYPFQPCFYSKARVTQENGKFIPLLEGIIKWDKNTLYPIEACGMACCLIRVDCLKKLEKPMFYPMPDIGEDITFCIKFRQAGFKLCLDTSLDIGHLSTIPIDSKYQQEALESWINNPNNEGKNIYL